MQTSTTRPSLISLLRIGYFAILLCKAGKKCYNMLLWNFYVNKKIKEEEFWLHKAKNLRQAAKKPHHPKLKKPHLQKTLPAKRMRQIWISY